MDIVIEALKEWGVTLEQLERIQPDPRQEQLAADFLRECGRAE